MPPLKPLPSILDIARNEADTESLAFKALDFLNRPSSAALGGIRASIEGENIFEGAKSGLLTGDTTGRDVLESLGVEEGSRAARFGGLALDIFNPLDPLNYVGGLGAFTKAGKGARLLGKADDIGHIARGVDESVLLGKTLAEQGRLGQRSLLTFAGQNLLPARVNEAGLAVAGRAGNAIRDSRFGRFVETNFTGKTGALRAEARAGLLDETAVTNTIDMLEETMPEVRAFEGRANPLIDTIRRNVKGKDREELTDIIDRAARGESFKELAKEFVQGNRKKQAAIEAVESLQGELKGFAGELDGTGLDAFLSAQPGFLPRVLKQVSKRANKGELTGDPTMLTGPSNNPFNIGLAQRSTQPINVAGLDEAGQRLFTLGSVDPDDSARAILDDKGNVLRGKEAFLKLDQGQQARFLEKHRLTIKQYDELLRSGDEVMLERSAPKLLQMMQKQVSKNVQADALVRKLVDEGLAESWDNVALRQAHLDELNDLIKTAEGKGDLVTAATHQKEADALSNEIANFVRVDQGRFAVDPVAVPREYAEAMTRFMETAMPGPDKSLLGLGLMSWWKGLAITGLGANVLPFNTRNLVSGVHKNYIEGMTFDQFARFYPNAADMTRRSLKSRGAENLDDLMRGSFRTSQGVEVSNRRLIEDYVKFGMDGRGSRHPEITELNGEPLSELRATIFERFQNANTRAEMLNRLPLAMKFYEDTFEAYRKIGKDLPRFVGERGLNEAHDSATSFMTVAAVNARDAIIRAHFDYDDLSKVERNIRSNWIPFYSWMRNNIPHETINMIQQPGKYMPYVRAYINAFENNKIAPEDLPEWAARSFALPLKPSEDDRVRWLDLASYLPFMDVLELGETALTAVPGVGLQPIPGRSRQQEVLRYLSNSFNPFFTVAAEQATGKSIFTQRSFQGGDLPRDLLGIPMGADKVDLIGGLFPPAAQVDRLGIQIPTNMEEISELKTDPISALFVDKRPSRNEPEPMQRILRAATGLTVREADDDIASISAKKRESRIKRFRRARRDALRDGDRETARFWEGRIKRLGGDV